MPSNYITICQQITSNFELIQHEIKNLKLSNHTFAGDINIKINSIGLIIADYRPPDYAHVLLRQKVATTNMLCLD